MAHKFKLKPSDHVVRGVVVYPVEGRMWEVVHELRNGQIKVSLVDVYREHSWFEVDVIEGPDLTDRSILCLIDEVSHYGENV